MLGEIEVKLRGKSYRLGYKYWPTGEAELKYGYINGRSLPAPTLKLLEIRYQELLASKIETSLIETPAH